MRALEDPRRAPAERRRIIAIDAVRGLALIGIVFVNFPARTVGGFQVAGGLDGALQTFRNLFLLERIYPLFALLFGLGLAIQESHAAEAGERFLPRALRRLGVLFVMGTLNALLVAEGDVLHVYAIVGLVLLVARRFSPRGILLSAAACWALYAARPLADWAIAPFPAVSTEIVAEGSWAEQIAARIPVLAGRLTSPSWFFAQFEVLAMMLLGLWAARAGIAARPESHRGLLRRLLVASLGVSLFGLVWKLPFLADLVGEERFARTLGRWSVTTLATTLQRPATAVFYGVAAFLLFQRPGRETLRDAVAPLGRAALTAYLLHGILGRLLFASYGFGLYGVREGPGQALALATVAALTLGAALWLSRFRYGPFEWLWRAATYLSWPPWSRRPNEPVPASGRS